MEIDKTTYQDLSIFNHEDEFSIFHKFDFTQTNGGKQELKRIFQNPLKTVADISGIQEVIHFIYQKLSLWPASITNGTIIMIDEYLASKVEVVAEARGASYFFNLALYKTIKGGDLAFITYSLSHVADFLMGCNNLVENFLTDETPLRLRERLLNMQKLLLSRECSEIASIDFRKKVSVYKTIRCDSFVRKHYRHRMKELIDLYYQLDAWHAMASAIKNYDLTFPEFVTDHSPFLQAEGLYHILLHVPVENDILLDREDNFLFLTGANMAGKSTFIKAVGTAVFLAHIGMGVPAKKMRLSPFDGILTNIQTGDNIFLGESYFYNEVQRVKNTVLKVKDHKHWLILIDELFKGTNIEDAKTCSVAVIRGLSRVNESLFILSTHLYEIANILKENTNIRFQYFETIMEDGTFRFNYHLKEGISNDRLGYLILKQSNVIDLLDKIGDQ
jgi:DNA mismatch repair protein MutS